MVIAGQIYHQLLWVTQAGSVCLLSILPSVDRVDISVFSQWRANNNWKTLRKGLTSPLGLLWVTQAANGYLLHQPRGYISPNAVRARCCEGCALLNCRLKESKAYCMYRRCPCQKCQSKTTRAQVANPSMKPNSIVCKQAERKGNSYRSWHLTQNYFTSSYPHLEMWVWWCLGSL